MSWVMSNVLKFTTLAVELAASWYVEWSGDPLAELGRKTSLYLIFSNNLDDGWMISTINIKEN